MAAPQFDKAPTAVICLSPYFGGMELDAFRFAQLLCETAPITLVVKAGSALEKYTREQADTRKVRVKSIAFHSNLSLSIIFGVRRIVREYGIKNVIYFGASELRSMYFSFLGQDINLIIRHGTTKSHPKKDPLHRLIYSDVRWHIPLCQHIADNVRHIIPFGKNTQLKVIYPSLRQSIDNPNTDSPSKTADRLTLLHVSRIAEGKGHIDAIRACQTLHDNAVPFRLICVGDVDPAFKDKLQRALDSVAYRDNILFPGFTRMVADYFQQADIFIFPSRGEGLSNAFIEALGYGLVCIAYDNTSFPELNNGGLQFLMAKDGDVEDLMAKLQQAVQQIQSGQYCYPENISRVKQWFNAQREHDELAGILR